MVRFLILHPISVFVFYAALMVTSVISLWYLPVSLLPEIDVPQINLQVDSPNKSPEEMDNQIVAPIRRRLLQINGLKDLHSTSSFEKGDIKLKFEYTKDIDYAFLEVNEKVDLAINEIPKNVDRPKIIKQRTEDLPVFFISIAYRDDSKMKDFFALSQFVDQLVRRRLEQLPEIAITDIHGYSKRQIVIVPNEQKINQLNISIDDLKSALYNQNLTFGSVQFKERNYQYMLKIGQPLQSVEAIRAVPLLIENRIFHLNELATVKVEEQELSGSFISDGQRAISLAIIKSAKSTIKGLRSKLQQVVNELEAENPELKIKITRDNTYILNYTISNLKSNLIFGSILVIGLVFLFYRNWRSSLISGIMVLASMLATLLFFKLGGLTVNMVTLSGIILGLGLMIDNGIIIIDNIIQIQKTGESLLDSCVQGVNTMIRPLLTSNLTTCSVFLPLGLLSGISGSLFFEEALAVSIGLFLSFFISITFIPVVFYAFERARLHQFKENNRMKDLYIKSVEYCSAYPVYFFISLLICLGLGYHCYHRLKIEYLPSLPSLSFEILIDWEEPILLSTSQKRIVDIIDKFKDKIKNYDVHFGTPQYLIYKNRTSSPSSCLIYLEAKSSNDKWQIQKDFENHLISSYPTAFFEIRPVVSDFELLFPEQTNDIGIEVYIENQTLNYQRDRIAQLSDSLLKYFPEIKIQTPPMKRRILISPRRDRLSSYEVEQYDLYEKLKQLISGIEIFRISQSQEEMPIIITNSDEKIIADLLKNQQITNNNKNQIPLKFLVNTKEVTDWEEISASGRGRFLQISIKTEKTKEVLDFLNILNKTDKNFNFYINSAYYNNQKIFRELLLVLLVTLIMLYLILVMQFESFLQPIIILLEVPMSLSGSLIFLYLFGESINIMAMIGIIVTSGVVINDSIIKIDTYNSFLKKGFGLKEAIHQGGIKRLNTIIMTSLTTILAVLPIFFSTESGAVLQFPLALTLTGGLIVGTLMSLYLIPLLFYRIYFLPS